MVLPRLLKLLMVSMWLGSSFAQKVTQAQPAMWVQEKEAVSLLCSYDTSAGNYDLLWYKQPSSGEMVFLIRQNSYSQQNATEGRYSLNLQKASKSIQLVISASQLGDSAVYFCALREGTVGGLLEEGAQKPRVCLSHPLAGGTKAGSGRAVSAYVWEQACLAQELTPAEQGEEPSSQASSHAEGTGGSAGASVGAALLGERAACGAESFSPDTPGGSQIHSEVQFFHHHANCAMVSTESWRQPHQSVFPDFRDKAGGKVKGSTEFSGALQHPAHLELPAGRLRHLPLCSRAQCS
ncbi:uncharacterized protein LOC124090466 [Marmota monax]|uniref:uncharacterized protein LOC124090466 n=1 Tax=Marmota monax TaxID=9995 RepID=UPI001EB065D7|nr:uncharacterized protein LOC124090466 [Marmota monax]